jgi:hypothetical protein
MARWKAEDFNRANPLKKGEKKIAIDPVTQIRLDAEGHKLAQQAHQQAKHQTTVEGRVELMVKQAQQQGAAINKEDIGLVIANHEGINTAVTMMMNSFERVMDAKLAAFRKQINEDFDNKLMAVFGMVANINNAKAAELESLAQGVKEEVLLKMDYQFKQEIESNEPIGIRTNKADIAPAKKLKTLLDVCGGADLDGDIAVAKHGRYSKPRIMSCGKCGETGHNKRTCTK